MQPGTLQSRCRWLVGDASAQKAESNGGHTPRGYPGQALPVGPGELSGMCFVTDTNRGPICLVKNAHVWTYALSGGEHNSEQILDFAPGAGSQRQNESRSSGIDAPFFVNAQFCSVLQETFR
jgi:hypothetical protein